MINWSCYNVGDWQSQHKSEILLQISSFFCFFSLLAQKMLKMKILTSVCSAQHPNTGRNIHHWICARSSEMKTVSPVLEPRLENKLRISTDRIIWGGFKRKPGRIKALLLRHKNDYCSACFSVAMAGTWAGYCGGRNRKGPNRKRVKFSIAALLLRQQFLLLRH